ncbi:hypothetical protein [Spirosoma endophyticum]|uniref:Uncharacterized protein n=1 Tax=Spirosoma endophyticum TaxID=662367 RepID=A0A1I2I7A9_9BACT|nr:hypothetical protein [Spirosoma endophyticum]SFF38114.1 hypothetical protein SAMN05216167_1594 [Spirosoma endophyticum]
MPRFCLALLFLLLSFSCKKEELALNGQSVKAQVLYRSCAGTILHWIDAPASKGQNWQWGTNPNAPVSTANPAKIYPNCVSAFDIPTDRQGLGDTLELTYKELAGPSGLVCGLGGLPTIYISVKQVKRY